MKKLSQFQQPSTISKKFRKTEISRIQKKKYRFERNATRTTKRKKKKIVKGRRRINPKILYIHGTIISIPKPSTVDKLKEQEARCTGHDKGDSRKKHHEEDEEERRLGRRDRRARKRERERVRGLNGLWVRYSPTIEKRSVRNKRRATGR